MRKLFALLLMTGAFTLSGYNQKDNPFFEDWKTPFQTPPFSQIRNEHYMPAFTEAMKVHNREIDVIVRNSARPTFENTIDALDNSGSLLEKVSSVFYGLNAANTNKEMQEIAKQLSPLVTKHSDDINLNPALFEKVKTIYKSKDNLRLNPDQLRLVEETYKGFVRGGANLDAKSQERLREINKEINMLQLTFGQNLLAETNAFKLTVINKEELAGLPESSISAASEAAVRDAANTKPANPDAGATQPVTSEADALQGKWIFGLQNSSIMPFLQFADNRALREKIFTAYINRCNNNNEYDNKALIGKLVALRAEKARLMGFENFASFILDDRMAKTPDNVYKLLDQVWSPAISRAKEEAAEMQHIMIKDVEKGQLEAWDWRYYNEKLMNQRFQLDEESLRPYFKLENVRDGAFFVANKLYGITFSEVKDAPTYYDGVKLFECKDADGSHLGVLYLDFHPRPEKRGGAWCGSYRSQSYRDGKRVAPVMTIVCNFSSPSADKPALLNADETETLFHEFGHAIAGLLKNVKYKGLSSVPRDFVELPSQIMEHWAFEPQTLKAYAKHYQTGMEIPGDLVEKIIGSQKFGQGFKTTEYLAASFLDMDYHILPEAGKIDVLQFESESMKKRGLIPQIPPRYRSTYFQHSMTGGYTAGYYSYIWAEVLDADAFQAFKETGDIFNREVAAKFRKNILEQGGSKDAMKMYIDFRGREPGIEPLLENRGLK